MAQNTQKQMELTPQDILQHWLAYCKYDPDQHSFNLLSTNYSFHKACKKMTLAMDYDPSGVLALLYAKDTFFSILKEVKDPVFDFLSDPHSYDEDKEMFDLFMSPTLTKAETALLDAISAIVDQVVNVKKIGERDREKERNTLLGSVSDVIEELTGCKVNLFMQGGPITKISRFYTRILLFDRLSECLLFLEGKEDGMYLCYVNNSGSADGYFGFYIKSNGTLLSVSERVDEAFPGQHKIRRTGRWTEDKKFCLFPYNYIFSFSDFDYKGYAMKHTIDDTRLDFCSLQSEAYMPLILAMVMLASKYAETDVSDMKLSLVDSLFQRNLDSALPGTQALAVPNDSALALPNRSYVPSFSTADVLGMDLPLKLMSKDRPYSESGIFEEEKNLFVKLYGEGFVLNPDKLLVSDPEMKALPPDQWAKEGLTPNPEFVGSADRMELIAYQQAREQLAAYIRAKMFAEFISFGGAESMEMWFQDALSKQKEHLFKLCAQKYYELKKGIGANITQLSFSPAPNTAGLSFISYFEKCTSHGKAPDTEGALYPFNDRLPHPRWADVYCSILCPFTGKKTSVAFFFRPNDWKELEQLFGSVPDVLRGWEKNGHSVYGNNILDVTDACSGIGTLFERNEQNQSRFFKNKCNGCFDRWGEDGCENCPESKKTEKKPRTSFNFGIAFSKRGFTALLKKYPSELFSEALSVTNPPGTDWVTTTIEAGA